MSEFFTATPPIKNDTVKQGTIITCLRCGDRWEILAREQFQVILMMLKLHVLYECVLHAHATRN